VHHFLRRKTISHKVLVKL